MQGKGRGEAPAAAGGGKQAEPAYFRRSRKGLRPEPAVCTRPGKRKIPPDKAAWGKEWCMDQSVMGVKTLSLLVSATISVR